MRSSSRLVSSRRATPRGRALGGAGRGRDGRSRGHGLPLLAGAVDGWASRSLCAMGCGEVAGRTVGEGDIESVRLRRASVPIPVLTSRSFRSSRRMRENDPLCVFATISASVSNVTFSEPSLDNSRWQDSARNRRQRPSGLQLSKWSRERQLSVASTYSTRTLLR